MAECCCGSASGATVDISPLWRDCEHLDPWGALFGESLGRILVSVAPDDREGFETAMRGVSCHYLGTVSAGDDISFAKDGDPVLLASMTSLREHWKGTLHGGGPR